LYLLKSLRFENYLFTRLNKKRGLSVIGASIVISLVAIAVGYGIYTFRLSSAQTFAPAANNSTSTASSSSSSSNCSVDYASITPVAHFVYIGGPKLNLTSSGFGLHVAYNAQNGVQLAYANTTLDSSWSGNLSITFPNGVALKSSSTELYNNTYYVTGGGFLVGGISLFLPIPQSYVPFTPYFNTSGTYQVSASLKQASSGHQFTTDGTFEVTCSSSSSSSSLSSFSTTTSTSVNTQVSSTCKQP